MEKRIGFIGTYINDYNFKHLVDIPVEVAVEWVKKNVPESKLDAMGRLPAKNLSVGGNIDTDASVNGWLNKLFVIIGIDHGNYVAIYNHDGKFSIRVKPIGEE